jgi:hypothetical protein
MANSPFFFITAAIAWIPNKSFSMLDILLRICCTRPHSVTAVELEQLSANRTTGVTCNDKSSTHIQTTKNNIKDFNSHQECSDRGSIEFTKESLGNISNNIRYEAGI